MGRESSVNVFLQVSEMVSMVSDPSTVQGPLPAIKPTPSIIQAAPTVYSVPPAPVGLKRMDFRTQRQSRMVCVLTGKFTVCLVLNVVALCVGGVTVFPGVRPEVTSAHCVEAGCCLARS